MKLIEIILRCFVAGVLLYGTATLALRAFEYLWLRRVSERKPTLLRYIGLHGLSVCVISVFTPALVYLVQGQMMIALGYRSGAEFQATTTYWVSAYLTSTALPLQFHYISNSRMLNVGNPPGPNPRWMPKVWTLFTFASVAIAWLPIWMGWLTLADLGVE